MNDLTVSCSYLGGHAHEWWIVYKKTDDESAIVTWERLKNSLIHRFKTLNKEKIARDKLAKWRQIKHVVNYNNGFRTLFWTFLISHSLSS